MTGAEPDDLRQAFAAGGWIEAGSACPAPERIWSAVHGEAPPEEGRRLVAHTVDCAACAAAWRLARDLAPSPAASPSEEAPERRRGWGALAAAAALVLVVGGTWLWRVASPVPPAYREGQPDRIRSLVPEDQPLPRSAFVLRWTPGPAGARYTVRVTTEDLTPVAEAAGLEAARFMVPPQALASLPAGTKLVWQVQALTPGGDRVASPSFVSRLE